MTYDQKNGPFMIWAGLIPLSLTSNSSIKKNTWAARLLESPWVDISPVRLCSRTCTVVPTEHKYVIIQN